MVSCVNLNFPYYSKMSKNSTQVIHKIVVVGPLQCNCSILACPETKEAILVDPGDEPEKILKELKKDNYTVKYLLHTHAHFDHINATKTIKPHLQGQICLHKEDEVIYNNLKLQGQMFGFHFDNPLPVEKYLEDEEILTFGKQKLQVIHTPGHSPGGLCFKINDEKIFTGDTLFQGSIGRSDLWGGNQETLINSIEKRLMVLEDDLPVFPGHGGETKIGIEKRKNPYLN